MKVSNGFSLIELLVVITITVILMSIGMVSYTKAGQTTRNGKRQQDLETLRQALVLYRVNEGQYPETDDFSTMMGELRSGGYLKIDEVKDPKNEEPYVYTYTGSARSFEVCAKTEPDEEVVCRASP